MRRYSWIALAPALAILAAPAGAQTQRWIVQFGSSARDSPSALAPDGEGGMFVAGATFGSLGGPSAGRWDAWIARYDGAGERLWIHQFGTADDEHASALTPDGEGGVFVAGRADGAETAWIARYTAAGDRLWMRRFGSQHESASGLAPDGAGGVFVGGSMGGSVLEDIDIWLARYDAMGNQVWLRQFITPEESAWAGALAPDGEGGAFLAGGSDDFGAGFGRDDAWLARYDSAGNEIWWRYFGSGEPDAARALTIDGEGGVFIAGETWGSLAGPAAGSTDAWIARFDGAGNQHWIQQFGTREADVARALAPDGEGGVFLAGDTWGSLAGPTHGFSYDAWIARYDSAGQRAWITQFGTVGPDRALALASDGGAGVFAAGTALGDLGGPAAGGIDVWIAHYIDSCYADCDGSGTLELFDFLCFQELFAAGDPEADCDGSGRLDFFDFLCFQNAFAAGCP